MPESWNKRERRGNIASLINAYKYNPDLCAQKVMIYLEETGINLDINIKRPPPKPNQGELKL